MPIDFTKEYKKSHIVRDARSLQRKFRDSLLKPWFPVLWAGTLGAVSMAIPPLMIPNTIASAWLLRRAVQNQKQRGAVCNYPLSANKLDPKKINIGKESAFLNNAKGQFTELPHYEKIKEKYWDKGDGIFYAGNDRFTRKELWISMSQFCTHSFYMGTTGSGKTEYLLSIMLNSLIQGSSYLIVDGKGDIKLFRAALSQARILGRENDVLLLNFLTGERDIWGAQDIKISNTLNFFGSGSADAIAQTLNAIVAADDDVWGQRMMSYIEALTKPLVYLRDYFKLNLDVQEFRYYFDLNELERLFLLKPFVFKGLNRTLSGVSLFLITLPGWDIRRSKSYVQFIRYMKDSDYEAEKEYFRKNYKNLWENIQDDLNNDDFLTIYEAKEKGEIVEGKTADSKVAAGHEKETEAQFGYITMQLTRTFGSLSDTYGYIMRTITPEIDMKDLMLHRRIGIGLLPSLAKSLAETKNLGRIIVAVIRNAMTVGLGFKPEGLSDLVVDTRPTNAPSPILIYLDECGTYVDKGIFVIPAQARSLGVSMGFAAQDITGLEQTLDKETHSVLANTANKFCGKIDDYVTAEFFQNISGEGKFAVATGFENVAGNGDVGRYQESANISLETMKRISVQDLRSLTNGHWYYFFKEDIFYIDSFFANTPTTSLLRLNHFIGIKPYASTEGLAIKNVTNYCQSLFDEDLNSDRTLGQEIESFLPNMQMRNNCAPLLDSWFSANYLANRLYGKQYLADFKANKAVQQNSNVNGVYQPVKNTITAFGLHSSNEWLEKVNVSDKFFKDQDLETISFNLQKTSKAQDNIGRENELYEDASLQNLFATQLKLFTIAVQLHKQPQNDILKNIKANYISNENRRVQQSISKTLSESGNIDMSIVAKAVAQIVDDNATQGKVEDRVLFHKLEITDNFADYSIVLNENDKKGYDDIMQMFSLFEQHCSTNLSQDYSPFSPQVYERLMREKSIN